MEGIAGCQQLAWLIFLFWPGGVEVVANIVAQGLVVVLAEGVHHQEVEKVVVS